MVRAYSYIRMSSAEQLKGDSLRRQLERSRRYAAQHGLELDESMQDLGVSAFKGLNRERGALSRFLQLVRDGRVERGSYLLVENLDRLSRQSPIEALEPFLAVIKAGIRLVTLADEQEYDEERLTREPWGLMGSIMVMMRAHEESKIKSDRLGAAWRQKQLTAHKKKMSKKCPGWLRLSDDRKKFEVIRERAKIVRNIFLWVAEGTGLHGVVKRLNEEGVPSLGGAHWYAASVSRLVADDVVLGTYQPHTTRDGGRRPVGEPVPNYYPPIVSPELAARARSNLPETIHQAGRRGETFSNIFTGIVKCRCGANMRFRNRGRGRYGSPCLVCSYTVEGTKCQHTRYFNYPFVEDLLLRNLHELDVSEFRQDDAQQVTDALLVARAEVSSKKTVIHRLVGAIEEGEAPASLIRRIAALEHEVAEASARCGELEEARATRSRAGSEAEHHDRITRLQEHMKALSGDDLYRLRSRVAHDLRRVVKVITFERGSIAAAMKTGLVVRYVWDEAVIRREAARDITFKVIRTKKP